MSVRNKQNPWFRKKNHVRLAKSMVTKRLILPAGDALIPGLSSAPSLATDGTTITATPGTKSFTWTTDGTTTTASV